MIAHAMFVQQQLQQLYARYLVPLVVVNATAIIAYVAQDVVHSHANAVQNAFATHVDVADSVLLILASAVQYVIWRHADAVIHVIHSLVGVV